jgi:hypothetical protein
VSKNQNKDKKKYMHINVNRVDPSNLPDWWKNHEEEFRSLSRESQMFFAHPSAVEGAKEMLV